MYLYMEKKFGPAPFTEITCAISKATLVVGFLIADLRGDIVKLSPSSIEVKYGFFQSPELCRCNHLIVSTLLITFLCRFTRALPVNVH